jgi:hypothetical protein
MVIGLNLPVVAFRGIYIAYQEGVEFEKADESSAQFREIASQLELAEKRMAEPGSGQRTSAAAS